MHTNLSASMVLINNNYVRVLYFNVRTTATVRTYKPVRASPLNRVLSPVFIVNADSRQ